MDIPANFKDLLPKRAVQEEEPWKGAAYLLWVFDPITDEVTMTHNKGRHRALTTTHSDMCPEVVHPGRLNGYAYRIKGGFRITDDEHHAVEDPHILRRVREALRREFPPEPLPNVHKPS